MKEAVHERDRHLCGNCGRSYSTEELDVDHTVPRGNGGSDRFSNLGSLCRRCHDAKHGNGLAPTVRFASTGDMTDAEFQWFKHFVKEMLPALARQVGVRLQSKYNLAGEQAWHLPEGDLRRLDKQLAESDGRYRSRQAYTYM